MTSQRRPESVERLSSCHLYLQYRPGAGDLGWGAGEILLEVLNEMSGQFSGLVSVFSHVSPGLPWSEHEGIRYAGATGDHFKTEVFMSFCLRVFQFPSDGCCDHLSAVNDIDSMPFAIGAFRPPGVYKIDPGVMLSEALAQKLSIGQKLPGHEGEAETRRKVGTGSLIPTSVPASLLV